MIDCTLGRACVIELNGLNMDSALMAMVKVGRHCSAKDGMGLLADDQWQLLSRDIGTEAHYQLDLTSADLSQLQKMTGIDEGSSVKLELCFCDLDIEQGCEIAEEFTVKLGGISIRGNDR